jgi:DNA mismatch repair protein MutL
MLLVDQHALHERILYEEFRQRVSAGEVMAQELLVPEPVSLSPIEVGLILDHREILGTLGLRVEEFGERCILVQSYPSILRKFKAESLLRAVAHHLQETGKAPTQDQLLESLLHMMACKAAVKAGDPLTNEEIEHLLELRHLVDDAHHCPHGRPTALRYSLAELERQFGRI